MGPEEEAREPCRGAGRASGLRWRKDGRTRPEGGRERMEEGLRDRLAQGTTLTEAEWRRVGVEDLRMHDYVRVGDMCYRPVAEEGRAWARVMGMSATAVEEAVRGDMERESAKRAGRKLWGLLLRHARGGEAGGDTEEENCGEDVAAERAAQGQWADGRHWEWCTYYPGGEEQRKGKDGEMENKARAGLERGTEGEREGVTRWVTEDMARERRAEQDTSEAGGGNAGAMPPGRPDRHVGWDAEDDRTKGDSVWQGGGGAGYAYMHTDLYDADGQKTATLRDEPLTRMLLRHDGMESGAAGVRDALGREVEIDKRERGLLWGKVSSNAESAKVGRVAMQLHMVHHFTNVAATDGSRGEVWVPEREEWETRVACGVYEGAQPGERRAGESAEDAAGRWVGEGMWGGGCRRGSK